jgi:hypothetical protein
MSGAHDGSEFVELVPVEGDYESAAYSSVAAVITLCHERGVSADLWPMYYGIDDAHVPLDEVRKKCESLRTALANLRTEDIGQHWWLQRVWEWLAAGEIFCVME